ncbi:MAG: hypothetical protein MJ186_06555 [Clostridia bacterium]|nr:hypothetical protein [Clostridia bacterium]
MKTCKLFLGVLTIVASVLVLFQSCAAGMVNTLGDTGEVSGTAGVLVAVIMITGGIFELATRKSPSKGTAMVLFLMFLFGALMGFANAGRFADLQVWSGFCLIQALVNLADYIKKRKRI